MIVEGWMYDSLAAGHRETLTLRYEGSRRVGDVIAVSDGRRSLDVLVIRQIGRTAYADGSEVEHLTVGTRP